MQLFAKSRNGDVTSINIPEAHEGDGGSEGRVYFSNDKTMCIKLFHDMSDSADKIVKLNHMLSAQFDALRAFSKNGSTICYPTHTAHKHQTSSAIGYVMPAAAESVALDMLFADTNETSKTATFADRVFIAGVLGLLVLQIHRTNAIIGDFNPANIRLRHLATAERWTLHIIDTDSFQLEVGRNVMTTDVGKDEYSSPRLLKARHARLQADSTTGNFGWTGLERVKEDDEYALAVIIFRILLSAHPMHAKPGAGSTPDNIAGGIFPYGNAREKLRKRAPVAAYDRLPAELKTMFSSTFTSQKSYSAKDWVMACSRLEKGLTQEQKATQKKPRPEGSTIDPLGLWQTGNMAENANSTANPARAQQQTVTRAPGGQTTVTQTPKKTQPPPPKSRIKPASPGNTATPPSAPKTGALAKLGERVANIGKAAILLYVIYFIGSAIFGW